MWPQKQRVHERIDRAHKKEVFLDNVYTTYTFETLISEFRKIEKLGKSLKDLTSESEEAQRKTDETLIDLYKKRQLLID